MKDICLPIAISFLLFWQPSAAQNYDNQAKKLDSEIQRIEKQQQIQQKNKQKVAQELKQANKEINRINKKVSSLNKQIKKQETLLTKLKGKQEQQQALQKEAKKSLSTLMQQYAKQQTPNVVQHLLSLQNISELERQQTYLNYFINARSEQIEVLRIELQSQQTSLAEYEKRKQQLNNQYKKQQTLASKASQQNKKKQRLLKQLDQDIAQNDQTIKKLKTDRKRLTALIQRLQQKKQQRKEYTPVAGAFGRQKGKMAYPVKGKVVKSFGQRSTETGLTFNGLAIKANKAGPNFVKAIYEGKVIFSNWLKGFGNLIIIDHGSGYMSLYGNNTNLNKKEGDLVNTNDTIATYVERNQVNKFYFEIRYKGKTINPRGWLR